MLVVINYIKKNFPIYSKNWKQFFVDGFYYIKGNINAYLFSWVIKKWETKKKECSCINTGFCEKCGCDYLKITLSGKKCK